MADSNAVELRGVVKRYGAVTAVQPMDLAIAEGSFVTLLGPSGCGKTTTLRMIAGLEKPSAGEIAIKGKRVNEVPIHRRNLGLVFQNYALFPHKSVFDNVAFGLKYRKIGSDEIRRRVEQALQLVQLPQMAERMPGQLSGGQQQRIALARAIVIQPDVLLLDEPLSALDANLREDMRVELKRIQHQLGITTIFVTHDQSEALAMSDRIVVMSAGRVEQVGSPETVYNHPATLFVAGFLGNSNTFAGKISAQNGNRVSVALGDGQIVQVETEQSYRPDEAVQLIIRAEKVQVAEQHPDTTDATLLDAVIDAVDYQGLAARYFIKAGALQMQAINPIDRHPFAEGSKVQLCIRAADCVLLTADGKSP